MSEKKVSLVSLIWPWEGKPTKARLVKRVTRGRRMSQGQVVVVVKRPGLYNENGMTHLPGYVSFKNVKSSNGVIHTIERFYLMPEEVILESDENESNK